MHLIYSARRELESLVHGQKARCVNKRLIWVDGDDFTGWCCSHCTWGITAPHLDSTVAALAFNRLAQADFERHNCAQSANGETVL
jgi:hypothetical protein